MQRKNKNRDSIISQSLNKYLIPSKDNKQKDKEKRKHIIRQKQKSKESIRCKSQNTHRIEDNLNKKAQCKTHRLQNSNLYHTLQSDKNDKIQDCYKRAIEELNLQNNKVNFNQFSSILSKIKKFLNKKVNLSEESIVKAWKVISKADSKVSERQLSFHLAGMSNLFTLSQQLHKPRIKMTKPPTKSINNKTKIKKESSNSILQKKPVKNRKISKSFISQKQNMDLNRFSSQRPKVMNSFPEEHPQLEVIVKIQQGIIQRLVVYPDTCLTTLARQFGAKYKLPNSKVVMLRDMIQSQLRKHLTQITEESADHYTSDRSGLFNTLNYDDI